MMTAPPYPPYSPAPRNATSPGPTSGTYPIPPYAVRYATPATPVPPPMQAMQAAMQPSVTRSSMQPMQQPAAGAAANAGHASRAPYRPLPSRPPEARREVGLVICGALLLFSALLCAIAFAVHAHAFLTAATRWAANTTLTDEARGLGLAAAKSASLWRAGVFGPGALAFGIGGIAAIVRGARQKRH